MKPKQEYKILPQNEKDLSGNNMIPLRTSSKKCSCCLTTFVILGFIAILGGVTGLTISLLYPHEFNDAVSGYWAGQVDSGSDNNTLTDLDTGTKIIDEPVVSVGNVTFVTGSKTPKPDDVFKDKGGKKKEKAPAEPTTTVEPIIVESDSNGTDVATNGTVSSEDSKTVDSSTEDDDDSDEESEELSSAEEITTKAPVEKQDSEEKKPKDKPKKDKKKTDKNTGTDTKKTESHTTIDDTRINATSNNSDDYAGKIVEEAEEYIENVTGIHRAEIVVPLFMFVCFLMSLLLASCCCYLLMRRKDNRRRRELGKIITDLQTGDSKSILLDQDYTDD